MLSPAKMDLWRLNLRHLRALAATVRLNSVSRAARAISISQPAITQAIGKLEKTLDAALFTRAPPSMPPTEAARLLTPRIEAALAHIGSNRVTMTQMRALIAVADGGGYAGASALTGLSQPALHRAIGDLSLNFGKALVERRGRGTMLTDAGRRITRGFRLARSELTAALDEVAELMGRETGRLVIGAMPLSRARVLPAAVTAFHRRHPEVTIRIVEGARRELIEPLLDGDIDLLIGALRPDDAEPDIEQTPLFADHPVVIARAGHPLVGHMVTHERLAAYPWIIAPAGTPLRTQWMRLFTCAGVPPPAAPIECGSVMTIRQILIDSDFLTLLSLDQVAVELEAGWLTRLCDAPGDLVRTIGVTWRANWRPAPHQSRFIALLRQSAAP